MQTAVEDIANLLGVSTGHASDYCLCVQEKLNCSITSELLLKGIEIYLAKNSGRSPSPLILALFLCDLKNKYLERLEESALDYVDPAYLEEERRREWEELPWPEEERDILYKATYGHQFGYEPQDEPLENTLTSIEDSLITDWLREQPDDFDWSINWASHKDRRTEIKEICSQQGVTSLIHFTRCENLNSILARGLISRKSLQNNSTEKIFSSDPYRYDNHREAVCLSISFPNYKMFYSCRVKGESEWVVLELDASILWDLDCAFCHDNAASASVRKIPLYQRKEASAFKGLFMDYPLISRTITGIPPSYPTNPQAEVLVFEPISTCYLKSIHFWDQQALQPWHNGTESTFWCRFVVNRKYFQPRRDYEFWR